MPYVLGSVGVRVWRGQWVRGAGPLETDAPTRELASDADELRRQMRGAQSEIESLGARLRESLAARDELRATWNVHRAPAEATTMDRDELERQMDEDRAALEHADQVIRDIDATLRESERVKREVMPELRRLGVVR